MIRVIYMENRAERYNLKPAAAWLRGHAIKNGVPEIDPELLETPLEVLTDAEDSDILFALKYHIVSVVDSIDATIQVFEAEK